MPVARKRSARVPSKRRRPRVGPSKAVLYQTAKSLGIPRRSKMKKAGLARAIQARRARGY